MATRIIIDEHILTITDKEAEELALLAHEATDPVRWEDAQIKFQERATEIVEKYWDKSPIVAAVYKTIS